MELLDWILALSQSRTMEEVVKKAGKSMYQFNIFLRYSKTRDSFKDLKHET